MLAEDRFVALSVLICEPTRSKMLWTLLDGRAYTASELAIAADVSATSASNHLARLLEAELITAETQGRHRYFSFARPEVAYAVEALANLATGNSAHETKKEVEIKGIKYCRTCYDHLAGLVGVKIVLALEAQKLIAKSGNQFKVTKKGWQWFEDFDIDKTMLNNTRTPVARQCLDWSERKPHLAGQLGTLLLKRMLEKKWFKKVGFSRELLVTTKGSRDIYDLLKIEV